MSTSSPRLRAKPALESTDTDLRAIVRARIAELDISQAEAARWGGMHPTRLSDWLNHKRDLYTQTLLDLFDGLGLILTIKGRKR